MKARIAEIHIRGREKVTVKRRATMIGSKAEIDKKLKSLARKGSYRSFFGAIDDKTGRLIEARDVVERGGRKTSVRVSPKTRATARRAVAQLARKAYGIRKPRSKKRTSKKRTSKKRTSKKRTAKRRTTKRNCGARTSRNGRKRRTSKRRTSRNGRRRRANGQFS